MRRVVNIFYQCVIGVETILLALSIYGMNEQWHTRMTFAAISQQLTLAQINSSADEVKKAEAKNALHDDNIRVLSIAQRKPFISFMSADEAAAVRAAKIDLGLSR